MRDFKSGVNPKHGCPGSILVKIFSVSYPNMYNVHVMWTRIRIEARLESIRLRIEGQKNVKSRVIEEHKHIFSGVYILHFTP